MVCVLNSFNVEWSEYEVLAKFFRGWWVTFLAGVSYLLENEYVEAHLNLLENTSNKVRSLLKNELLW